MYHVSCMPLYGVVVVEVRSVTSDKRKTCSKGKSDLITLLLPSIHKTPWLSCCCTIYDRLAVVCLFLLFFFFACWPCWLCFFWDHFYSVCWSVNSGLFLYLIATEYILHVMLYPWALHTLHTTYLSTHDLPNLSKLKRTNRKNNS